MLKKLYFPIEKRISTVRPSGHLLLVVWLLTMGGLLAACNTSAASPEPEQAAESGADYAGKKILWFDSYHQGYEWSDGIYAGLTDVLDETDVKLEVIHMDTKRNTDDGLRQAAALEAKAKIETFEPDVVIVSDDNAQKYLVTEYLKDTELPVIFNGVNWDASDYGYPASNVTGMVEVDFPQRMIDQLSEYAEGSRLGYVTGDSATERKISQYYNDHFFEGEMKVYFVDTFDDFKEAFLKAQNEADIIYIGNNAGLDEWDEAEATTFFAQNTQVPTGTDNAWMAPYTLISLGKIPDEQGEWAAQTALDVLDGTSISEIPITKNERNKLIVNLDIAEQIDVEFAPFILKSAEIVQR